MIRCAANAANRAVRPAFVLFMALVATSLPLGQTAFGASCLDPNLTCDQKIDCMTGECMQREGVLNAGKCRGQAQQQAQCGGGSNAGNPSPAGGSAAAPSSRPAQSGSPAAAAAPALPSITETGLFTALQNACGKYSGAVVLKILPCGSVLGNESASARQDVWPLIKDSCRQLRSNCSGTLHDIMVDLSSQFHCDAVGAAGDVCK